MGSILDVVDISGISKLNETKLGSSHAKIVQYFATYFLKTNSEKCFKVYVYGCKVYVYGCRIIKVSWVGKIKG